MCGILGYSAATRPSKDFMDRFTRLFELSEARGTHASGMAWEARNGMGLLKLPVRASGFVQLARYRDFEKEAPLEVVAHTRWASQGDPAKPFNNHPHLGLNLRLAVVHNGHISNWKELAFERGFRMQGTCDSEVIARLVERGLQGRQDLLEAVRRAGRAVFGGATFAAYLVGKQTVVYRWHNPLSWAKVGDSVVFSSDGDHIKEAFGVKATPVWDGQAITIRRGQVDVHVLQEPKRMKEPDRPGWYRDPSGRIQVIGWEER